MPIILYILIFNFLGSIVSLVGGLMLLVKEKTTLKYSHLLASFAAGALLGAAFFELLPEAAHEAEGKNTDIFLWTLIGFISFFILERFIHFFHSHDNENHSTDLKPTVPLVVVGDSVHNFIDGVAIASAFMVSIPLGIVTSIAVALHEIPQEIADFGLLLHKGISKWKVILINFASALISIIGALFAFYLGEAIVNLVPIFLSITAGFFIYIAATNLIPEIHNENRKGFAIYESMLLILGVIAIWATTTILSSLNLGH